MNEPNDIIYQAIDIDINGGFETGDFTAWETIGDTSIETAEFGVIPTQGDFQALLTTDFGSVSDDILENFLGLNSGDIDGIGNGDATQGSALRKTITVEAGDVLSFDFNFLTDSETIFEKLCMHTQAQVQDQLCKTFLLLCCVHMFKNFKSLRVWGSKPGVAKKKKKKKLKIVKKKKKKLKKKKTKKRNKKKKKKKKN